ncbi:MAG: hypothetical protein WAO24_05870 [Peptococcia bacterium]
MEKDYFKIASKCPYFDSIRSSQNNLDHVCETRAVAPRCQHCSHWLEASCDLFQAR